MGRRSIKSIRVGAQCFVSIHRDSEWNEYIVTSRGPAALHRGTYHTTDKKDARGTAADIIRRLRRSGACK